MAAYVPHIFRKGFLVRLVTSAADETTALADGFTKREAATLPNVVAAGPIPLSKSAAYTVLPLDGPVVVTGTTTITLPSPATAVPGKRYTIKNAGAAVVTAATGAGLIDGSATQTLAAGVASDYINDGTNWFRV